MPITKLRIMYIMLNRVSEGIAGVMKEVFRLWPIRIHPLVGCPKWLDEKHKKNFELKCHILLSTISLV